MSNLIRYRYAWLLLLITVVLVTNPVWHATAHLISDHSSEHTEHVFDEQWAEEDRCRFCDADSQIADAPSIARLSTQLVPVGDIVPVKGHDADLRLLLSTRLRAPPALT